MTIRVLIADDQPVVRDGLAMLLGLIDDVEVVATAADGIEAVHPAVPGHLLQSGDADLGNLRRRPR